MHFVGVATLGQPLGPSCASTVYRKAGVDVIVNGSNMPGIITPGSYGTGGTRTFWHVARADTVAAITGTEGSPYRPIVIEIDNPQATVARLRTQPASR